MAQMKQHKSKAITKVNKRDPRDKIMAWATPTLKKAFFSGYELQEP